jgi:hypothetical protein
MNSPDEYFCQDNERDSRNLVGDNSLGSWDWELA